MVAIEVLEEYTGQRDDVPCYDIKVRFSMDGVIHERFVNVCFDEDGQYDVEATIVRIKEVSRGVESKIRTKTIV